MGQLPFLASSIFEFRRYQRIADSCIAQLSNEQLHQLPAAGANSVVILMKHMAGNMLSRWTDFLTSDGEKEWRNRDQEFIDLFESKEELMAYWNRGWSTLFSTLETLTESELEQKIVIRGETHSVYQAILRQIAHYAYHVGQILLLAKIYKGESFENQSIEKGRSEDFNKKLFRKE